MRHRLPLAPDRLTGSTSSSTPALRQWLRAVKVSVLSAALVTTAALGSLSSSASSDARDISSPDAVTVALRDTMARHSCSTVGFGDGQVPASALVRSPSGKLRATTFDEGWAVLDGRKPGRLVAVCLDDVRSLRATVRTELPWPPATVDG